MSSQIISVPFTTLVAGLICNLDICGWLFDGETLEKVNMTEPLIVTICSGIVCVIESIT